MQQKMFSDLEKTLQDHGNVYPPTSDHPVIILSSLPAPTLPTHHLPGLMTTLTG